MSRDKSARRTIQLGPLLQRDLSTCTIESTLEFITPVFGGGTSLERTNTHIKEPDRETPVRGASLRGQLRTWWRRACCEGLSGDQMVAREKLMWGWATQHKEPSKGLVSLSVIKSNIELKPKPIFASNFPEPGEEGISYGAFPLRPDEDKLKGGAQPGVVHIAKGTFRVRLALRLPGNCLTNRTECDDPRCYRCRARAAWSTKSVPIEEQLTNELWRTWIAFVTFGGLGGRTRRGFGAIREVIGVRSQGPEDLREVPVPYTKVLDYLGWKNDRVVRLKTTNQDPIVVLNDVLAKLRGFRQAPGHGRFNKASKVPGVSLWPEPNSIRRITKSGASKHSDAVNSDPIVFKFPRAAFGLPIIFHFKDQKKGEPESHTLAPTGPQGKVLRRMASPIILRPTVGDKKHYVGIALRLPCEEMTSILGNLTLHPTSNDEDQGTRVSGSLTAQERQNVPPLKKPPGEITGAEAVLIPFFEYFKQ